MLVATLQAGPSLLRCLVDAGGAASLFAADAEGKVPADIAQRNGNGCALRLLADAGSAEKVRVGVQRGCCTAGAALGGVLQAGAAFDAF